MITEIELNEPKDIYVPETGEARLKVKINTLFFLEEREMKEVSDIRIGFVTINTLIKYKIFNQCWKVIKFASNPNTNKTVIYIQCLGKEEMEEDTIYIHPTLAAVLNFPSLDDHCDDLSSENLISFQFKVSLSEIYDEIQTSQIKHQFSEIQQLSLLRNLPIVKKIKIQLLGSQQQNKSAILEYFKTIPKMDRVISLNEVIAVHEENTPLAVDIYYGTFTNKNQFIYFHIVEIEYEEYDYLRSYLNINQRKVINIFNTSKETSYVNSINAFTIMGDDLPGEKVSLKNMAGNIITLPTFEIEITNIAFSSVGSLPRKLLDYFNNREKKKLKNCYRELIESAKFKLQKTNLKSLLVHGNVFFSIGPTHCGINYLLSQIGDEIGMKFIKKDLTKFKTGETLLTYLKKLEFMTPCMVKFKNCKKLNSLLNNANSGGESKEGGNLFNELKSILRKSLSQTQQIFYFFSFENSTEIENYFKILADSTFEYTLPDIESRINLLKTGFSNALNNLDALIGPKFEKKLSKLIKRKEDRLQNEKEESLVERLSKDVNYLNYFDISKLTVGYNIKEIKNLIKSVFFNLLEQSSISLDFELIKSSYSKLKTSRLKSEKTISSIPEVKWEDVGGLEHAKEDINDTIQLPIKYPKLFENSLKRRSGLLLYGPPGSGKTLLAKAIANECSMNFISVKGPELLNMYVGESEKNIREVFERGRSNRPCCLFFDEIDALAPARTKNSDQNNVMDRIVAQFMTEMDGLTKENDLIIIASTNRPDLVDPSLLRPGRFDKMIYVGLPKTVEEKIKIYQAQTLKLKLADDVDFITLAEMSPEDYSGADIYAVCSLAFTTSLKEKLSTQDDSRDIIVCLSHFQKAIKKISPSLPKSEIKKYEDLKEKYSINK